MFANRAVGNDSATLEVIVKNENMNLDFVRPILPPPSHGRPDEIEAAVDFCRKGGL